MSDYFNSEIHRLLSELKDPSLAADRIIQNIENDPELFSAENIQALAHFLWHCGFYATLLDFILRHLDKEFFIIPWSYFAEAVGHIFTEIDEKTLASITEGLKETSGTEEWMRSTKIDSFFPEAGTSRRDRKYQIHKKYRLDKEQHLQQLITLRTQQLYEQEKSLLDFLKRLYPGDNDIYRELQEHQQRYAVEILEKHSPRSRNLHFVEPLDTNDDLTALNAISQTMLEICKSQNQVDENMAYEFAVALYMMESPDLALQVLELAPESANKHWLRMELLLKTRHFVELMSELGQMEYLYVQDPETIFASTYLRAQALWGLGQKHAAIETIENLISARPYYRSAPSLLAMWSGQ